MNTSLKLTLPILLFLAFFQSTVPPGSASPADTDEFCSQSELHRQKLQQDDAYRIASQRLEEQLYSLSRQPALWNSRHANSTGQAQRGPLVQHTLPVVVHIIHNGGSENISDARTADAIQHLNDAFANTGYYNPATGVDTEIAFCLARRDPQGNATTGVNRVQSALTDLNSSTDDQALKDLSRWNPLQYINVWVVREICSNNGCGVAGYAYLPGAHGLPYDGIVLEAAYMGSNPTASTVLVHEMGHYLGLYHTFEGGCPNGDCRQQGDRVCDTPPDNTTARTPCSADMNSCGTDEDDLSANNPFRPIAQGGLGDQVDQKENYMDYSRFECYDRFSQGQKDRMLSVAETIRSSLLDSPACIDPCPSPVQAGFTASALSVPLGATVNFTNTSINADSYEWALDGTPFSTATDASYTFNTEGSFEVTLTAFSNLSNCLPADSAITIEVFCPVVASFTGGNTTVLAGASIPFTNTSTSATAYTWLVNGTVMSNNQDYTLNTTEPGLYNVCLRAEGALCESLECSFVDATAPNTGCGNAFFYNLGDRSIFETAECLIPAADGGFYLGGSWAGQSLLMKFDADGNRIWQKAFSFSTGLEEVFTLMEDGQYLVGSSRTLVNDDQYCFKYDMNTEGFDWIRSISNPDDNRTFEFINIESSPNYILIGYMRDNSAQGCDVTWGELDKNSGNLIQLRKYTLGSCETGTDAVLVNDKVYVTGRYNAAGGGQAAFRPAITEFELDGTDNWTRLYLFNTNSTARLYSNSIIEDNGYLVICGYGDLAGISTTSVIGHISKTGLDGAIEWATVFDIAGGDSERLVTVLDQGDGYLAIGFYNPFAGGGANLCLIKVDKAGNLMWAKSLDNGLQEESTIKGAFARDGYAYISANTTNDVDGNILLFRVNPFGELDTECGSLQPLPVESRQLDNPFDGFFDLTSSPFTPANSAEQINLANVNVPIGNSCSTPCEEICMNGLDDDGDGLADCEDADCPCFDDCGGTFVERIGTPGRNEGAMTIIPSADGNFYVGGYAAGDAVILKMAPNGAVIWQRTFDFSPGADEVRRLILGDDGYLYGASSNTHGTVFCYDPENDVVLWSNTVYDAAKFLNISINPTNGNILACGGLTFPTDDPVLVNEFPGMTYSQFDIALTAEFDRNTGELNWRREYQAGSSSTCYEMEWVGDIYYSPARFTHDAGQPKMRPNIAAFNANGEIAWAKHYITPASANARMYAFCLERATDGLVAGFMGDPNGTGLYTASRTGLFKTDFAGNLQWAKRYALAGYDAALGTFGMAKAPDGYLLYGYAAGATGNGRDLTVIKTDEAGEALWAMAYGGPGEEDTPYNAGSQILVSGNSIYLVGRSRNPASGSTEDMIIIRASAEDGAIQGNDCGFATPIPISTELMPDAVEEPTALSETPFSAIAPQFNAVQPVPGNMDTTRLCSSSPVDLLLAIDSAYCNGDSLAAALRICNEGADTLPAGIHFTFYDDNPTANAGATVLAGGFTVPVGILPGECYSATVTVPYPQGQLYCIANDDGSLPPIFDLETDFPPTELIECDYTNNIDSAGYETTAPEIDLGPDTSVCENGVFLLDAGPGFAAYRWQDGAIGQTYTTFETGTFWVEATTACGDVARDTIDILLDIVIPISLGPDTTICEGSSATLSTVENPDYTYQWSPAGSLDCADCPSVTAQPDTTTTYTLVASNTTGCVSVDSIILTVVNCDATLDTAVCINDSILIEGQVFYPNQSAVIQLMDGSNLLVNVAAADTALTRLEAATCFGQPYLFNGMALPGGSVTPFAYTGANGCDSTLLLTVTELEEIQTFETVQACQGETGIVFGQPVTEPGIFSATYTSFQGCDSTHTISFEVLDTALLNIPPSGLSCTSLAGRLTAEPSGGNPPYAFLWSDGQATATATGLAAGAYSVTVTDALGCQSVGLQEVYDSISLPVAMPIGLPASCHGEKDGSILIGNSSGGTPPYEYSLDGQLWQSEDLFIGLAPGSYIVFIRDQEQCASSTTLTVGEPSPLAILLPGDTTLRLGDSLRITPLTLSGMPSFYEWMPPSGLDCADCPAPVARPLESTLYRLTVQDSSGCAGSDELFIDVDKTLRIYLPNAFSPNEDGKNDFFTVFAAPEVEQVQTLQVFGRWGEQVFKRDNFAPNQESLGWDGTFRGQRMPGGVYAYYGEVVLIDGRVEVVKGEVTLIR
ncbi:MAG: gliding motility-associated C-terminal domain-containing protein [Lewinellaceae bacterium]|nr:gliding motility-associated C-terminal domain-containing protein [Phaeodactylibacter sp.]MCB9038757.1 gliding motility-associated C-terminal domain-containing protein [Lewinellaceae bacterium]